MTTMQPEEFKAWFEGFTDGWESSPSEKDWLKICERVKQMRTRQDEIRDRLPFAQLTTDLSGRGLGVQGISPTSYSPLRNAVQNAYVKMNDGSQSED
jgi:hypothetical protein